jgi:hypothetical protein
MLDLSELENHNAIKPIEKLVNRVKAKKIIQ